jgi:hypothetical protein
MTRPAAQADIGRIERRTTIAELADMITEDAHWFAIGMCAAALLAATATLSD